MESPTKLPLSKHVSFVKMFYFLNQFLAADRTYTSYTYDQLREDVTSVAHRMQTEFGLKKGDGEFQILPLNNQFFSCVRLLA